VEGRASSCVFSVDIFFGELCLAFLFGKTRVGEKNGALTRFIESAAKEGIEDSLCRQAWQAPIEPQNYFL
jgi:hypothetical protein